MLHNMNILKKVKQLLNYKLFEVRVYPFLNHNYSQNYFQIAKLLTI